MDRQKHIIRDFNRFELKYLVTLQQVERFKAPSGTSTQYSLMHNYDSVQAAGTMIHIGSESGAEDLLTFTPTKDYQSVVISSPAIKDGDSLSIYSGGSSSGTHSDGL